MTTTPPPVDLEALRALAEAFKSRDSNGFPSVIHERRSNLIVTAADELESLRAQLAARDEEIAGLSGRLKALLDIQQREQEIGAAVQADIDRTALAARDALLREAEDEARRILVDCKWMTGDKAYHLRTRSDRAVEIAGRLLAKLKAARGDVDPAGPTA